MKVSVKIKFCLNATKVVKINNPYPQFKLRILSGPKKMVGFGLPSLINRQQNNNSSCQSQVFIFFLYKLKLSIKVNFISCINVSTFPTYSDTLSGRTIYKRSYNTISITFLGRIPIANKQCILISKLT